MDTFSGSIVAQIDANNRFDAMEIKTKSSRFFFEEGLCFQRGFNQSSLRCLVGDKGERIL